TGVGLEIAARDGNENSEPEYQTTNAVEPRSRNARQALLEWRRFGQVRSYLSRLRGFLRSHAHTLVTQDDKSQSKPEQEGWVVWVFRRPLRGGDHDHYVENPARKHQSQKDGKNSRNAHKDGHVGSPNVNRPSGGLTP